ncbi:MAG: acyl-CoA thioesterase [Candidatus Neomarinimicrobiota bacterium]|nr:acyl-CoA thioesterase [Candidatus Neomarinimicrobiota bacterium]MCD6100529.1 acyl-CoA thioesterase [Candidatus Neomarinimicrobiota bacterium]RKY50902.1 MAG: acyl-CoA thioesterase [Candidatus Neomarinimicrobiota bacterium]RKY54462.1 MAG: acyl-CoA thioesterase [Candidatus Neomarinimicrobiota bacterium]
MSKFCYRYRVRYKDVDRMGVMYYSRYFEIFEEARTELLREIGITYREMEEKGFSLPVVEAHCRYKRPALYDNVLEVYCWVSEFSGVRMTIDYDVLQNGVSIAQGSTTHAVTNDSGRITRLSPEIADLIKEHSFEGAI